MKKKLALVGVFALGAIAGVGGTHLPLLASAKTPPGAAGTKPAAPSPAQQPAREVEDPKAVYRVPVDGSPARGPGEALVTIVEVADFECPFCKQVQPTLKKLDEAYPGKLRWVFKHNPISAHRNAAPAAKLAEEARAQGGDAKFWAAVDRLFAMESLDRSALDEAGRALRLDAAKLESGLQGARHIERMRKDKNLVFELGARATPTFFVNGRKLVGALPYESFKALVDEELAKAEALARKGVKPVDLYARIIEKGATAPVMIPAPDAAPAPAGAPGAGAKVAIRADDPVKGPALAPVTVVLFSDFQCPFCSKVVPTVKQIAEAYPKDVRIVWKHMPLPFHQNALPAAKAAEAARAQGKFWEMHDRLFAGQQALSDAAYAAAAKDLGLDLERFRADAASEATAKRITEDGTLAAASGTTGTPTLFVNCRKMVGAQPFESFKPVIDEEIAKARKGQVDAGWYDRACAANLAAAPAPAAPRDVKVAVRADDPSRGRKDAKVTVVEFSDFQCPFCSRAVPVVKQVEKEFGSDVRIVFKHLPLPMHPNAMPAALAAEAARQQGKFWEMHDRLFAGQQSLSDTTYGAAAKELGLDVARFESARKDPATRARVEEDAKSAAAAGVTGTPTFVVDGEPVGARRVSRTRSGATSRRRAGRGRAIPPSGSRRGEGGPDSASASAPSGTDLARPGLARWLDRPLALLGAVAAAVALGMGGAVTHPFLRGNDELDTILENPVVQGPLAQALTGAFRAYTVGAWAPLHLLSHALDRAVFGSWAGGSALVNLALHALAAFLVARLARRLGAPATAAWGAAVLFAIHPVQVEAVVSITQRKTVLSGVFLLAAMNAWVSYARAEPHARRAPYALAVAAAFAALLTKPVAVVIPLALVLLDLPLGRLRPGRAWLLEKLPFVAGAAALVAVTLAGKTEIASGWTLSGDVRTVGFLGLAWWGGGPRETFFTVLTVLPRYLALLLWPARLSIIYAPPVRTGIDLAVLGSAAFVAGVALGMLALVRRAPRLACWAGLFFVGLLPVSQLVPQTTLMNDRYLYVPMFGAAPLAAEALLALAARLPRVGRAAALAVAAAALVALGATAQARTALWAADLPLWEDAARKAPESPEAWYNLGHFREDAGNTAGALEAFARAAALDPRHAFAASHASTLLLRAGRWDEARPLAERAAALVPGAYDPLYNVGFLRLVGREPALARDALERAIALAPDRCEARTLLAHSLALGGEVERAAALYGALRGGTCDGPDVALYRAFVAGQRGDAATAERELSAAFAYGASAGPEFLREPTLGPLLANARFDVLVRAHLARRGATVAPAP
jgi:protein-disulfide isomerase/Tfp pilus assembly protein PilF